MLPVMLFELRLAVAESDFVPGYPASGSTARHEDGSVAVLDSNVAELAAGSFWRATSTAY